MNLMTEYWVGWAPTEYAGTRGWSAEAMAEADADLVRRGLVADGALTEQTTSPRPPRWPAPGTPARRWCPPSTPWSGRRPWHWSSSSSQPDQRGQAAIRAPLGRRGSPSAQATATPVVGVAPVELRPPGRSAGTARGRSRRGW
ncbi:helix-turn-helix domain-containing protein [Geodermatophilus sp. SYSU D01176]